MHIYKATIFRGKLAKAIWFLYWGRFGKFFFYVRDLIKKAKDKRREKYFLGIKLPVIAAALPSLILDYIEPVEATKMSRKGQVFYIDVPRGNKDMGN